MCEPISTSTLFTSLLSATAGKAVMEAIAPKKSAPALQAPSAPPASQAAKLPEQKAFKTILAATGDPTMLTGPSGIPSDKLTLGKSTLLGA